MSRCKECLCKDVCKIIHFPSMFGLTGDACEHFKPKISVCGNCVERWKIKVNGVISRCLKEGAATTTIAEYIVESILEEAVSAVKEDIANTEEGVEKHFDHFKPKSIFLSLPFELGQTVYYIAYGRVYASKVAEITVVSFKEIKFAMHCYGGVRFDLRDFGKTVFLSREEAEKALKERERE